MTTSEHIPFYKLAPGTYMGCTQCGKRLSEAQAIYCHHLPYCVDCTLWLLQHEALGEGERVEVSVDLLQRLRDGVV